MSGAAGAIVATGRPDKAQKEHREKKEAVYRSLSRHSF